MNDIPGYLDDLSDLDSQIADLQNRIKSLKDSGEPENSQQLHDLNQQLKELWDQKITPVNRSSKPKTTYSSPEDISDKYDERKAEAANNNEKTRSKKYEDTRR